MKLGGLMNRTAIGCPIKVLQVSPVTFDTVSALLTWIAMVAPFSLPDESRIATGRNTLAGVAGSSACRR